VVQLVVNQTSRLGEARAIRDQLQRVVDRFVNPDAEQRVKLELLGEIPIDPMVRAAVQKRQLLLETHPGSEAAKAVKALAAKLVR